MENTIETIDDPNWEPENPLRYQYWLSNDKKSVWVCEEDGKKPVKKL